MDIILKQKVWELLKDTYNRLIKAGISANRYTMLNYNVEVLSLLLYINHIVDNRFDDYLLKKIINVVDELQIAPEMFRNKDIQSIIEDRLKSYELDWDINICMQKKSDENELSMIFSCFHACLAVFQSLFAIPSTDELIQLTTSGTIQESLEFYNVVSASYIEELHNNLYSAITEYIGRLIFIIKKYRTSVFKVNLLDAGKGYYIDYWSKEHCDKLFHKWKNENNELYVLVIYKNGSPHYMLAKENIFYAVKKAFDNVAMYDLNMPAEYAHLMYTINKIYDKFKNVPLFKKYIQEISFLTYYPFYKDNLDNYSFGICVSYAYGGCDYIDFNFTNDSISIIKGGSVYDEKVGSNSFSEELFYIDSNRYYEYINDFLKLENIISDLIDSGATLSIELPENYEL